MSKPSLFLMVVAVLVAFGPAWASDPISEGPRVILTDCRRENDAAFSKDQQKLIQHVRQYLEKQDGQSFDAYYRITSLKSGHEVFVIYIAGYSEGMPFFCPGNFCKVRLDRKGNVIKVMGGS